MNTYRYLTVSSNRRGVVVTLLSHVLRVKLLSELRSALHETDPECLIITGPRPFFAAGADIAELAALDGPRAVDYARFGQQVFNEVENRRGLTVAAIDGFCMGGGLDLALACSLRFATPKSILAHPGGRIGIMTGWGGTRRLPLMIGKSRALEMMAAGRRVTAAEAEDWGLINGVVDDPVGHALNLVQG